MNFDTRLLARALPLALATAFAMPAFAADPEPDWSWTGHVDLNSAYYLRGITNTYGPIKWPKNQASTSNAWGDAPESRKPALQWGVDFTHKDGWYVGYWASQLTYSYERLGTSYDIYKATGAAPGAGYYDSNNSIENDFYGGYTGKIGDIGYDIGATYYYYAPGKHSNAAETKVKLTYGDFGLSAQTLLADTIWGNSGDTYWSGTWTKGLPYDITFTANVGYYTYSKEGDYLGSKDAFANARCGAATPFFFDNGCYAGLNADGSPNNSAKLLDGGFRHLILGISQPIGSTGLTWNAQAIIAGVNRYNVKQDDKFTVGISYGF